MFCAVLARRIAAGEEVGGLEHDNALHAGVTRDIALCSHLVTFATAWSHPVAATESGADSSSSVEFSTE